MRTFTVWTDGDPDCEELTVIEGTKSPDTSHVLLHTIKALDWNTAMVRYHELMGWEPYKPIS